MTDEVIRFCGELEKEITEEFGEEATPEFLNMMTAAVAAYEHGFHGFVSREKFLEFMGRMYEAGKNQLDVRTGEAHGRISVDSGHILNVAAYLSMFGERDGYLSSREEANSSP